MIAVIGIPDAVVVRTRDALLVTTREHAQRVKEVPETLKQRDRTDSSRASLLAELVDGSFARACTRARSRLAQSPLRDVGLRRRP